MSQRHPGIVMLSQDHHHAAEEEALFPSMRAHVPTATALVDTLTIQHRQLRGLITLAENGSRSILDHMLTGIIEHILVTHGGAWYGRNAR